MDLVSLKIQPKIYDEQLISLVTAGEAGALTDYLKRHSNDADFIRKLPATVYMMAARYSGLIAGLHPLIFADAVTDLLKTVFIRHIPAEFIHQAVQPLTGQTLNQRDNTNLRLREGDFPEAVIVSDMALAVYEKNLPEAQRKARDILFAIDVKKYFNENLLEIGSEFFTTDGRALVTANAAIKALELFEWRQADDIILSLLEYFITMQSDSDGYWIEPSAEPADYKLNFLKALNSQTNALPNILYMAHARQAYRYGTARYHFIWKNLSAVMSLLFSEIAIAPDEHAVEVPLFSEAGLLDSLVSGEVELFLGQSIACLKSGKNENEWLFLLLQSQLSSGRMFTPAGLIYLNALRRAARALKYPAHLPALRHIYDLLKNKEV